MSTNKEAKEFESEVLRVARLMFPSAIGGGSETVEAKERDGIFVTQETVHCIECTIDRSKNKATKDINKLQSLVTKYQREHFDKSIKLWFITRHEPTADQRAVANKAKHRVIAVSLNRFASRLANGEMYLRYREDYGFGSARDPETGAIQISTGYIKLDLRSQDGDDNYSVSSIAERLIEGENFLLVGDFGVGKSMTSREVYKKIKSKYHKGTSTSFPVYVNLRDHPGQDDPEIVLIQHCKKLGFPNFLNIVRAWRAGYVLLILDGFDEISSIGFANRMSRLRDIRYKSMTVIRKFIDETPNDQGILLCGRSTFFDSPLERNKSLTINAKWKIISVDDFSPEQVKQYLQINGAHGSVPEWLPSRPLLLGYLISKGVINNLPSSEAVRAKGWSMLLDEICSREAKMVSDVSPDVIRTIIEKIANRVRSKHSGVGPIFEKDLSDLFTEVVGYSPDESSFVILQRLPGLGPIDAQDGSRQFIDADLADVAKGSEVAKYALNPFNHEFYCDPGAWGETLSPLGLSVADYIQREELYVPAGKWVAATERALDNNHNVLAADLFLSSVLEYGGWAGNSIRFQEVSIPELALEGNVDLSDVEFRSTIIGELLLEPPLQLATYPHFEDCLFGHISGQSGSFTLPPEKFVNCEYDSIDEEANTTKSYLSLELPVAVKVAYTVIKKVYVQSGAGRLEIALYRGLDQKQSRVIPDVLKVLQKHQLIAKSRRAGKDIWFPIKAKRKTALALIYDRDDQTQVYRDLSRVY